MKYNKLIRDKIPEIIKQDGKNPITRIATDEEYWQKLKEKLKEEVDEFLESENEEELADIYEVLEHIYEIKKLEKHKLKEIKEKKAEQRGSFKLKIILEEVKD